MATLSKEVRITAADLLGIEVKCGGCQTVVTIEPIAVGFNPKCPVCPQLLFPPGSPIFDVLIKLQAMKDDKSIAFRIRVE